MKDQQTTEALLKAIKGIPRLFEQDNTKFLTLAFIYETQNALKTFDDPKSQEVILSLVSKKIQVDDTIFDREWESWEDLKLELIKYYFEYHNCKSEGIETLLKEVSHKSESSVKTYYETVMNLLTELILAKLKENNWTEFPSIVEASGKFSMECFIEGLRTDLSGYVRSKNPQSLLNAYEITENRLKKMMADEQLLTKTLLDRIQTLEDQVMNLNQKLDEIQKQVDTEKVQSEVAPLQNQIEKPEKSRKKCHKCHERGHLMRDCPKKQKKSKKSQRSPSQPRHCQSLGIETDMNDSRKFIFLIGEQAPADMIKMTCLPEGTQFTKQQDFLTWNDKKVESIGKLFCTFDFGEFRTKRQLCVLSEDVEMEDDGVLKQNFGKMVEKDGECYFTYEREERLIELKLGVDCPKQGKCGHYFNKTEM